MGRQSIRASVIVSALTLVCARPATADEVTPIRVRYGAPGVCPGAAKFTSEVLGRTLRLRLASRDDREVVELVVTVSSERMGFTGRLQVSRGVGRGLEREVEGDSCEEVVSALALVTALAFDPNASTEPVPAAASEATPRMVDQNANPRGRASAPARPSGPTRPAPTVPTLTRFAFGALTGVRSGVTPNLVLALPVFVEAEHRLSAPFTLVGRLAFERSRTDTIDLDRGTGSFRFTLGTLEACPLEAVASENLRLLPCLRVEAGSLTGEGHRITPARSQRRLFLGLGAIGRAEWVFLPPAFAEFAGGVVTPLTRDRFYFQPDSTVHRAAALGFVVRAGLGLRFP